MKFRLDPSRTYLAIGEPSLYELFQSSRPAVPADAQISAGAAEAYICAEKENSSLKVYLAFRETAGKVTRIFTPESQPCGTREYHDCIDAARKFMTDLGFSMEQVNLNYSTAMRQVIWGAIKIFKVPKVYAKPDKRKGPGAASPPDHAGHPEPEEILEVMIAPVAATLPAGEPDLGRADVKSAADSVTPLDPEPSASRVELDQALTGLRRLQKTLDGQIQAHEVEKTCLEAELSSLKEQLSLRVEDAEKVALLSEENQELKLLLSAKETALDVAGEQLASAGHAVREAEESFSDRLEAMGNERDALSAELCALKQNLSGLEAAVAEVTAQKEESARNSERNSAIERELRENAEKELFLLGQEKDQIERVATAALNSAREERKELVDKIEAQEREKTSMIEEFEAKLEALRLSEERAQTENMGLKKELFVTQEVSARELAGLRGELTRLIEELASGETGRLMIESHQVETGAELYAGQGSISDVESYAVVEPEAVSVLAEDPDPQGSEPGFPVMTAEDIVPFGISGETGDSATEFRLNRQLAKVHCPSPDDLIVLYESQNKVQTVPDGFKIQKSGGYICAIKRNGSPEIFLVWKMLESKQAAYFTPRHQPQDEQGFQQVLQDALFYFDSVGFMMSPVDLNGPASRSNALKMIQMHAR